MSLFKRKLPEAELAKLKEQYAAARQSVHDKRLRSEPSDANVKLWLEKGLANGMGEKECLIFFAYQAGLHRAHAECQDLQMTFGVKMNVDDFASQYVGAKACADSIQKVIDSGSE